MPSTHCLESGRPIKLSNISTEGKRCHADRDAAEKEFRELRDEFVLWQWRLYAEGKRRLLIIFQAMDAGGKDGAIRHVFQGVNPQGVRVTSFKAPSANELAHDFLWRIHHAVPATGMIEVFNRSHYEDVLVVRVEKLADEAIWGPRYEQINQFEKLLTDTGTTILKFYLHISKDEQKKRFQERLQEPEKHWKFSTEDLVKRRAWDDYMEAYEDALNRCTTAWAPWYVIPADQKWYRNLAVTRVIVETLREMNPQPPASEVDAHQVEIE
jgi:PPK2 family polyphosphate:nucleotide phosphotransferase